MRLDAPQRGGRWTVRASIFAVLALAVAGLIASEVTADSPRDRMPGIIGTDDRVIHDQEGWPWTAIGRLNLPNKAFCTGTLVASDVVLTAAHCLFDKRRNRSVVPKDVHFLAGYRRGEYAAHAVAKAILHGPNRDGDLGNAWSGDWSLLVLATPLAIAPIPVRVPVLPLTSRGAELPVSLVGYSRDRPHLLSKHRNCRLLARPSLGDVVLHDCDTTFGGSGSPLLSIDGGDIAVLAVVSGTLHAGSQNRGIAVSAAAALDALTRYRAGESP